LTNDHYPRRQSLAAGILQPKLRTRYGILSFNQGNTEIRQRRCRYLFTAKSEARANLQLDVELEDAGIETGRGKDYSKPVRTDFPVYNDLPEESTVDYTGANATNSGTMDAPGCQRLVLSLLEPWTTTLPLRKRPLQLKPPSSVPLENRTPAVRFAVHLTSDKYQSHITKEQQLAASEMSLDEGNTYLQNLLLAKSDILKLPNSA
jgi:exodeoxyribonuclease VIII